MVSSHDTLPDACSVACSALCHATLISYEYMPVFSFRVFVLRRKNMRTHPIRLKPAYLQTLPIVCGYENGSPIVISTSSSSIADDNIKILMGSVIRLVTIATLVHERRF